MKSTRAEKLAVLKNTLLATFGMAAVAVPSLIATDAVLNSDRSLSYDSSSYLARMHYGEDIAFAIALTIGTFAGGTRVGFSTLRDKKNQAAPEAPQV